MIEDVIESKKVVESTLDALIEAQDQRPIKDNKVSDNLGPDVTMEVVKEFGEWFGCCTTVPDNVDSSFNNLVAAVPVNVDSSFNNLVAEENREVRPLFSTATMSPISKAHNDDHSMDVDNNGQEELFQSTHPPSIITSEKRREIRDSFNEDETVFLVNTSFSSVKNHPNDLKVSLSNRIREINARLREFKS